MIIQLSIVDLHRPPGVRHVGTVLVEIPELVTDSCFDAAAIVMAPMYESRLRPYLGRVMDKAEIEAMEAEVSAL